MLYSFGMYTMLVNICISTGTSQSSHVLQIYHHCCKPCTPRAQLYTLMYHKVTVWRYSDQRCILVSLQSLSTLLLCHAKSNVSEAVSNIKCVSLGFRKSTRVD